MGDGHLRVGMKEVKIGGLTANGSRSWATTDAIREPEEVIIDPGEEVILEERVGADLLIPGEPECVCGGHGGQVGHQGEHGGIEAGRGQQGWHPGRDQRGSGYNGRVAVVGFEDETGHCGGGCSNVEMDKERCGGCQPGQGRNEVCQGDR